MSRNYPTKQLQDVESIVSKLSLSSPQSYKQLCTLMNKYKRRQATLLEIYRELIPLFQKNQEYLEKINGLLHEDLKITSHISGNITLKKVAEDIFTTINTNLPDEFQNIRTFILAEFHNKRGNSRAETADRFIQRLIELFKDSHNFGVQTCNRIIAILENYAESIQQTSLYEAILNPNASNAHDEVYEDYNETEERAAHDNNRNMNNRNKTKNVYFATQENQAPQIYTVESVRSTVANQAKSEAHFFESLKEILPPKSFEIMMKLIQIYMNCILSFPELVSMAEPILSTLDKKMITLFKDILDNRDGTRKKSSLFFASIKDKSDNSMFEGKCNESYHKFIPSVPLMKNSTDDPIAIENCNKYYFSSQPVGDKNIKENNVKNYESGVAKKNTMKNVYEETLFKIEDERFEVDVSIERYRFVLKWLEKLIDPATPEDQCSFFIEKIRKFQVIEQIYGQKTEDIIKGLESHKTSIAPIVIARFQEKLDMFKEIKAKYERENWVQSLDACFHRSLDQKSFSIKYYDKKLVLNKSRLGLTRLHRRVGVQRPNSSQWDQRVEEQNP